MDKAERGKGLIARRAKPRRKLCRVCQTEFMGMAGQHVCGVECAAKYAREKNAKADAARARKEESARRKEMRESRERLKSRADHAKEAQAEFNAWVRARDAALPCISCGRYHQGSYDAGHYRTVKSMPSLRFEPDNCHKQCVPCNQHKSGNIVEYRINLVKKIGAERVGWLEGPHEPRRYTIDELKAIKLHYRALRKELESSRWLPFVG